MMAGQGWRGGETRAVYVRFCHADQRERVPFTGTQLDTRRTSHSESPNDHRRCLGTALGTARDCQGNHVTLLRPLRNGLFLACVAVGFAEGLCDCGDP